MGALPEDRRMDCEQYGVAGGPSDPEIGLRRRTRNEVCLEGFSEEVGTALGEVRAPANVFVSCLGREETNEAGSQCFLVLYLVFTVVALAWRNMLGPPWGLSLEWEQ